MTCLICKQGKTGPGKATVTLERGGATIVVKGVPAQVCGNCGEQYVDDSIATRLFSGAEQAAAAGVQVDVREYIAA